MLNLDELEGARAAASQGEWFVTDSNYDVVDAQRSIADCGPKRDYSYGMTTCCANAAFIALAANKWGEMLAEVRRLREGSERLKMLALELDDTLNGHQIELPGNLESKMKPLREWMPRTAKEKRS